MVISAGQGRGPGVWVCAFLEASRHGAGEDGALSGATATPGGYPRECPGLGAPIADIPPYHPHVHLWPPASVQPLTITPAGSQGVAVLGTVVSWGHPSALQLPQCVDVQLQSLLLNGLGLP